MRTVRWLSSLPFAIAMAHCGSSAAYTAADGSTTVTDALAPDVAEWPWADATVSPGTDATALPETSITSPDAAISPADVLSPSDAALAPPDADTLFADAGALGPPAIIAADVRTSGHCDTVTACGGDVTGTWDIATYCVEVPIGDAVARCPGASITRADGTAQGRVVFDGLIAHRVARAHVEVDVFIPALCANFVGGCTGIETTIRSGNPDSSCVATATGDCNCASRVTNSFDQTDGYSTSNNQIVSSTLQKRWDYCITGDSLRYDDVSPNGTAREPGIVTLGRRR